MDGAHGEDEGSEVARRLSRGSRWFLVMLVIVIVGGGATLLLLGDRLRVEPIEPGQPVVLEVPRGTTQRAVGDRLEELGVISSSTRFRLDAESVDLARSLQPGEWDLVTGMGTDEVIARLVAGPDRRLGSRFTIPEGLTVEQTLDRLADQFDHLDVADFRAILDERTAAGGNVDGVLRLPDWVPEPAERGPEVIEPYEGLLAPQTFDMDEDATALQVLQRMVNHLASVNDQIAAEEVEALEALGLTRYDALILASLIERETRVDAERELVAGVITNRLDRGMRLQIDATVLYARGEPTDRVLFEDTEIDSPYNTYQVTGLPPTPISGVGAASQMAAYRPQETTSLYYVLDPACDGTHRFADTLDEHNRNVQAFRAAGGCR
jgi:UPF0755 protein